MGSDQKVDGHPSAGPFPDPHHHRCSLFLGLMSRQTRFQLKSSANNIAVTVSIAVLALFSAHLLCGFLHRRVRKAWLAAGALPEVVIGLTIVSIGTSLARNFGLWLRRQQRLGTDPASRRFRHRRHSWFSLCSNYVDHGHCRCQ